MSDLRPCIVIPTHNHVDALDAILSRLQEAGLPVIVIDDASDAAIGERIRALCEARANVEYQRHAFNGGKGFAVLCGIARASERRFTHAVQIDADGQHDLSGLDALLEMARLNPAAIVTGVPQFNQSIPLGRRIGRPVTNFWVAINTLSLRMPDAMCGFRVYPVGAVLDLVRESVRGRRMDFDIELLVKAHWAGIAVAAVPVRVNYPKGNFSNFQMLRDNVLLTLLQTRLFFGMLVRMPQLVFRRNAKINRPGAKPPRWASLEERGVYWGMRILAAVYRVLGRRICLAAMTPVVLYFFLTGRTQRDASREYLMHMWRRGHLQRKPTLWLSFRHFLSFSASTLDKLSASAGDIPYASFQGESVALLEEVGTSGRGALVITAHIGNPEAIRAVAALSKKVPVNVLMHTEHARLFNRLMKEFSPNSPMRAFAVTKVGIDTAVILSEAIAKGEWVVIAGDRVPVAESGRVIDVPFLGELAPFPQGPYILGALLKAPAFLLFCVRQGQGFQVHFSKFAEVIELPRGDRIGAIRRHAARYAEALEARVAEAPLQWFNFYSFWNANQEPNPTVIAAQRAAE